MYILVSNFFLGARRNEITNRPKSFVWLDGVNVGNTFHNFSNGEPNNADDKEDCVVFFADEGDWRSERCSLLKRTAAVCQRMVAGDEDEAADDEDEAAGDEDEAGISARCYLALL